ncbi:MAG TPA: caspase family protein, partial [Chitinophagaceae bacterium]
VLKKKLLQTTVNDKVIIAYSGHGLLSKNFDYYLSTYNVNFSRPEVNGLLYDELENLLDSIPARKKLMLIDACFSGEVDKEELMRIQAVKKQLGEAMDTKGVDPIVDTSNKRLGMKSTFDLMQQLFANVGKSTGAIIIAASGGTQFAREGGGLKNSVFTYCVLEAMKQYPSMNASRLNQVVSRRVTELTHGLQRSTLRNEQKDIDWKLW